MVAETTGALAMRSQSYTVAACVPLAMLSPPGGRAEQYNTQVVSRLGTYSTLTSYSEGRERGRSLLSSAPTPPFWQPHPLELITSTQVYQIYN